jgi:hypothetical protein
MAVQMSKRGDRTQLYLAVTSVVLFRLGYEMYRSVFSNFAGGELGLGAEVVGLVESVREIPGLLAVFAGLLCFYAPEHILAGVFLLVCGVGLMSVSMGTNFWTLAPAILVFSVGFHFYTPLFNAISLRVAGEEKAKVLGQIAGLSAAGRIIAGLTVFLIVGTIGIRGVLVVGGFLIMVGAVPMFLFGRKGSSPSPSSQDGKRILLRREYSLYYAITFLDSVRRNILNVFSPFALVVIYGVDVRSIAMLSLMNHLATMVASPQIGKFIGRIGCRRSLILDYSASTLIFLGLAFIPNPYVIAALSLVGYVLFFAFRTAVFTYVDNLCGAGETVRTLYTGQTFNHISGFTIPALGGFLWASFGYTTTFLFGATTALLAVVVSMRTKD